jgi:hypothetical protein
VAKEALEAGNRPLNTTLPITELAWMKGWDAAMRLHGNPPVYPQKNRALVAGYHVQFCLIIAQGIRPICMELFLSDLNLADIHSLLDAMQTIHFDRFIISLKGSSSSSGNYHPTLYWHNQPPVLDLNKEKCSGCFLHVKCHQRGPNRP